MVKTGLFFGSFNPIHKGHTNLAAYLLKHSDLDEIWFVVSPENPWKTDQKKPDSGIRLKMVNLAIENTDRFSATNFEENLPKPSYTYQSLKFLNETSPDRTFVLLIGGDNLDSFDKWANFKDILNMVDVWAYPRAGKKNRQNTLDIKEIEAPLLDYSSSEIRDQIKSGSSNVKGIDAKVLKFIVENKLYQS